MKRLSFIALFAALAALGDGNARRAAQPQNAPQKSSEPKIEIEIQSRTVFQGRVSKATPKGDQPVQSLATLAQIVLFF